MRAEVREAWRGLPRFERVLLGIAGTLLVAAPVVRPITKLIAPRFAVRCALVQGDDEDPWGQRWVFDLKMGFEMLVHSCGPNGVDEGGSGDDVSGVRGMQAPLMDERGEASWPALLSGLVALVTSPLRLAAVASVAAWFVLAPYVWFARRRRPAIELILALGLASLPMAIAWFTCGGLAPRVEAPSPLLVSPGIAVSGTAALVAFLVALARRLSRPVEAPAVDAV